MALRTYPASQARPFPTQFCVDYCIFLVTLQLFFISSGQNQKMMCFIATLFPQSAS